MTNEANQEIAEQSARPNGAAVNQLVVLVLADADPRDEVKEESQGRKTSKEPKGK